MVGYKFGDLIGDFTHLWVEVDFHNICWISLFTIVLSQDLKREPGVIAWVPVVGHVRNNIAFWELLIRRPSHYVIQSRVFDPDTRVEFKTWHN